jgi:hypothetical protein
MPDRREPAPGTRALGVGRPAPLAGASIRAQLYFTLKYSVLVLPLPTLSRAVIRKT